MDPIVWQFGQVLFMLASVAAYIAVYCNMMSLSDKFNLVRKDYFEHNNYISHRISNIEKSLLHTQNRLSSAIAQSKRRR